MFTDDEIAQDFSNEIGRRRSNDSGPLSKYPAEWLPSTTTYAKHWSCFMVSRLPEATEPPEHLHALIVRSFANGLSLREISRITGLNRITLRAFRASRPDIIVGDCQCGRPAGHNGWCVTRYQASRLRQLFVERWHLRNKGMPRRRRTRKEMERDAQLNGRNAAV